MLNLHLNKINRNDRKAQEAFYKAYANLMFNTAYRYVSNEEDAAAIVNISFYKIFTKAGSTSFENEIKQKAWMRKIVINESLMHIRKTKSLNLQTDFTEEVPDVEFETETSLDLSIYLELIAELPTDLRTVFNLFVIDGFKHDEIAQQLSIAPSSSRTYLCRAKQMLQEKIKKIESDENK